MSRDAAAHFQTTETWESAAAFLTFSPRVPSDTAGRMLRALRIHVMDHRQRQVPIETRTLEALFDGFALSQARKGDFEARRLALSVSYGSAPRPIEIAGHAGRAYELGPEPPPDDVDGRMPSVVTWHDKEMFYLIASDSMRSDALVPIAVSLYSL